MPAQRALVTVNEVKPVFNSTGQIISCDLVFANDLTVHASLELRDRVKQGMFVYVAIGVISKAVHKRVLKTAPHYRETPRSHKRGWRKR